MKGPLQYMSIIEMRDVVKNMTTGQQPCVVCPSKWNQENSPTL